MEAEQDAEALREVETRMLAAQLEDAEMEAEMEAEKAAIQSEVEKDFRCHNCDVAGYYKSAHPKMEYRNCGKKGHNVRKCPKPPKLTRLCFKCGKPGHKEMEYRSGKNPPVPSTASQHVKSTTKASSHQEDGRVVTDGPGWTTVYKQSQAKQDVKDRTTALDRIQELMIELGNNDKPLPRLLQLSQQPTSVLLDQVRALEMRLRDRDGVPKNEMVFKETHKLRKIPAVSKEKDIAPGKESSGQIASVDAPVPALHVAEAASKAAEDQVAGPEKGNAADSKPSVPVGPLVSSRVQPSRSIKGGSPVSKEKAKRNWASDEDSDASAKEPAKSQGTDLDRTISLSEKFGRQEATTKYL